MTFMFQQKLRRFDARLLIYSMTKEETARMPFGKFKNKPINEIDSTYLEWVLAKWKMADWLMKKLDQIAESGYQELQENQVHVVDCPPLDTRGGALLEQEEEPDDDNPFDPNWIIE